MAHLLGAEALHLEFPTRVIFDSVTAGLNEGDRIGVVGRNGDGKSTLLRLLAGRLDPDAGRVTRRGGIRLGMLDQADELHSERTVHEVVIGDIDEHVWAGDPKVRDVIAGLIADLPWEARVDDLSGGQRRRVALAALLIGDWDVVFLDEPTNHLDVEGIAWLAKHLKNRWPSNSGALVTVTHDRWFLDEICTATWEVHDRTIEPFEGGYAAYVLQRAERDRMAASSEAKRQNLLRKELAWLRRGPPARTSKPKFRIDAANALIEDEPPLRDSVSLSQLAMQRLGKDVVDLENVSVSFGPSAPNPLPEERDAANPLPEERVAANPLPEERVPPNPLPEERGARLEGANEILRDITWRIAPGERTGILGVNGAGKSTLLNLVAGGLQPTSGRVKRGKTVRVAQLAQQLGELEEVWDDRVSEVIARQRSGYLANGKELTPGQLLERLGFTSAQLSTPVRDLSGGQKRRLQLLLVLLSEPNVLILDEPTNDLDTDMLAAIEDLLDFFPGTLIVVSHDRYLLERVTDQQYAVMGGRLRHLPRGVDQYLELRAGVTPDSDARSAKRTASPPTRQDPLPESRKPGKPFPEERESGKSRPEERESGKPHPGDRGPGKPHPGDRGPGKPSSESRESGKPHPGDRGPGKPSSESRESGKPFPEERGARLEGDPPQPSLYGAELRTAEKELAALGRKLEKLDGSIRGVHDRLAAHDQSDYVGLGDLTRELTAIETERELLETRWLELAEVVGG